MANEAVACSATGGGGGDEIGTASSSAATSPKNRVKFLCSYGGKILPRHVDGQLKYVGGETRVIAVHRDINFSELMKKLSSEFEVDMVLKYQLIPEDLDMLVSVRTDEDLKHMLEEYDRHESEGTAKLRAFLFPSTPIILENQNVPADPHAVEQRYIDAINNTVRSIPSFGPPPVIANRPTFSISACSSPKCNSPENTIDGMPQELTFMNSYHNSRFPMLKVHSSPSLYNLNATQHQSNNLGNHQYYQHHHHQFQHHHHGSPSARPPHEPRRLGPSLTIGHPNFGRAPINHSNQYYSNAHNWNSSGHNIGSGISNTYGYHDGCRTFERVESHPTSPRNKILE